MNRLLKIALCAAALSTMAAPAAFAQNSSTVTTTTATTKIIQPIVLTRTAHLRFASVVKPTSGTNTVTITGASDTVAISGAGNGALTGSGAGRAAYSVAGEGAQTFAITVPSTMTMTRVGGAQTLTVNLTPSAATGALDGTLGTVGAAVFQVGGNFDVADTTTSGDYTGLFNVTVSYN